MTFEEIFNEDGLYVAESFMKGVAFKIENENLFLIEYDDKNDLFPQKTTAIVYKGLFEKDYKKVFNRYELFK